MHKLNAYRAAASRTSSHRGEHRLACPGTCLHISKILLISCTLTWDLHAITTFPMLVCLPLLAPDPSLPANVVSTPSLHCFSPFFDICAFFFFADPVNFFTLPLGRLQLHGQLPQHSATVVLGHHLDLLPLLRGHPRERRLLPGT